MELRLHPDQGEGQVYNEAAITAVDLVLANNDEDARFAILNASLKARTADEAVEFLALVAAHLAQTFDGVIEEIDGADAVLGALGREREYYATHATRDEPAPRSARGPGVTSVDTREGMPPDDGGAKITP
jgi:hypothetical protein